MGAFSFSNTMKFFQAANPFRKPSAEHLRQEQLDESKRQLVTQEQAALYHAKMAEFYRDNIARLEKVNTTA